MSPSRSELPAGTLSAQAPVPGARRPTARELDQFLPPVVETYHTILSTRFDPLNARDLVEFMDHFWRVAGNEGFYASQERIRQQLLDAGFDDVANEQQNADSPRVWYEEFPAETPGWTHTEARVTMVGRTGELDEVILSRERHRVTLCINSFPTPIGGLVAPVVDVGDGTNAEDYEGKDVRGAVVLGDGSAGDLWGEAVAARGALGVISTELAGYISPDLPGATPTPREAWDVLQWDSIPYDAERRSFGFKATPRAATRLRERLAQGLVTVRVDITSTFSDASNRTLVAEIPGRSRPNERIVLVAHVQEPGANDNASGCGTLLEIARTLLRTTRTGELVAPSRTLTFLWVDEMRGSLNWLARAGRTASARYMMSLDMIGEDTTKTGGMFLIEKAPDPSAVWARPSDPRTEWDAGGTYEGTLTGTLLNDLHYAVCLRRSRSTGWLLRTNPYEGGSDHTVFLEAGVPALLNWHFTDRFYHTNLDRPDKTSSGEMMNVGVAVASTAMLLASAGEIEAEAVVRLVAAAAEARLDVEGRQSIELTSRADDRAAAVAEHRESFAAWKQWYLEALDSVLRLPIAPAGPAVKEAVAAAQASVRARELELPEPSRRSTPR